MQTKRGHEPTCAVNAPRPDSCDCGSRELVLKPEFEEVYQKGFTAAVTKILQELDRKIHRNSGDEWDSALCSFEEWIKKNCL